MPDTNLPEPTSFYEFTEVTDKIWALYDAHYDSLNGWYPDMTPQDMRCLLFFLGDPQNEEVLREFLGCLNHTLHISTSRSVQLVEA